MQVNTLAKFLPYWYRLMPVLYSPSSQTIQLGSSELLDGCAHVRAPSCLCNSEHSSVTRGIHRHTFYQRNPMPWRQNDLREQIKRFPTYFLNWNFKKNRKFRKFLKCRKCWKSQQNQYFRKSWHFHDFEIFWNFFKISKIFFPKNSWCEKNFHRDST